MDAAVYVWDELDEDSPIASIHRKRIAGEKMLVAMVRLDQGCFVAPHRHDSEQIAYVLAGRARWTLGDPASPEYRETETGPGSVVVLPGNLQHSVLALEDTHILDLLSPVGEMGIDRQQEREADSH